MRLLLAFLVSFNAFAGAGVFPQGDSIKMIKNKLKFQDLRQLISDSVDPQAVATPADQGSVLINDNGIYFKTDDGTTTNWIKMQEELPDQTGNGGKFLYTTGFSTSWLDVDDRTNVVKDNLITCSNFDGCTTSEWVVSTNAALNLSGGATRTLEAGANNTAAYLVEGLNVPASDYTISLSTTKTTGDFAGKQMVGYCEVRTSRPDVKFQVYSDSVLQGSLDVSSDDTWKYYKIPFVGGSTDMQIKIDGATASQSVIRVDNCFIGKASNVIREIGSAHFVGSLTYQEPNCAWGRASATIDGFPIDGDCSASNITGNVSAPDTAIPAIKIPNPRTDGYYKVEWFGLNYAPSGSGACWFSLSSSNVYENQGWAYTDVNDKNNNILSGNFRFSTSSDKTIQVINTASTSTSCNVYGNTTESSKFTVHFYPDDSATIVTQDTELTAKTANEFTAKILSTGEVQNENYDWLNGNCTLSGTNNSVKTCTLNTTITAPMNCVATATTGGGNYDTIGTVTSSTSQISFTTYRNGSQYEFTATNIHCSKQGTDYNKSQTIVGKFENINSSDLLQVVVRATSTQTLTSGFNKINLNTEEKDNYNAFNTTTNTFTSPKDTCYAISALVRYAGGTASDMFANLAGTATQVSGRSGNRGVDSSNFASVISISPFCMLTGETIYLEGYSSVTRNTEVSSSLTITELPDYEAIVKNLSDQSVKCQTKTLSGDVSANGVITDWVYNNLTVGKKYKFMVTPQYSYTTSALNDKRARIDMSGAWVKSIFNRWWAYGQAELNTTTSTSPVFTALTTTLTPTLSELTSVRISSGSISQLCELPDTYVETTQF